MYGYLLASSSPWPQPIESPRTSMWIALQAVLSLAVHAGPVVPDASAAVILSSEPAAPTSDALTVKASLARRPDRGPLYVVPFSVAVQLVRSKNSSSNFIETPMSAPQDAALDNLA